MDYKEFIAVHAGKQFTRTEVQALLEKQRQSDAEAVRKEAARWIKEKPDYKIDTYQAVLANPIVEF